MRSPSFRGTASATRAAPRNVPFLLPQSSIVAPSSLTRSERVAARHARVVDPDRGVVGATEEVVPRLERDLPHPPDEPVLVGAAGRPLRGLRLRAGGPAEGVAEPGHRPQEGGLVGVVLERLAQLVDENGQVHVGDEGVRPQPVVDLGLRDGVGPALDEQLEELERFGREVNRMAAPLELPRRESRGQKSQNGLSCGLLLTQAYAQSLRRQPQSTFQERPKGLWRGGGSRCRHGPPE